MQYPHPSSLLQLTDTMEGGLRDLPSRKAQVVLCGSSVTVAIWNTRPNLPRTEVMASIDLDAAAVRALRDHLTAFLES